MGFLPVLVFFLNPCHCDHVFLCGSLTTLILYLSRSSEITSFYMRLLSILTVPLGQCYYKRCCLCGIIANIINIFYVVVIINHFISCGIMANIDCGY